MKRKSLISKSYLIISNTLFYVFHFFPLKDNITSYENELLT